MLCGVAAVRFEYTPGHNAKTLNDILVRKQYNDDDEASVEFYG